MTIHDADQAAQFDSRKECRQWIADRIVRFKLKMVKAATHTPGEFTFVPRKSDGEIFVTTEDDYKKSGTDEPLKNYAEPHKHEGKWLPIMRMSE